MLSGVHGACRCPQRPLLPPASGGWLAAREPGDPGQGAGRCSRVLAPRQEERNCTGAFFMLRQLRLLSLNCVPDGELEPEVSPCALTCPRRRSDR